MRLHIGSDHAGFELKAFLSARLSELGHEVLDHGPSRYDAEDDYPPFCLTTAAAVAADSGSLGLVMGGSGNGEQIAANKVAGVRAALTWSVDTAQLARQHNDANVMSLGARMHGPEEALDIARAFVETPFSGDERHVRRIRQLADYELSGVIPSTTD